MYNSHHIRNYKTITGIVQNLACSAISTPLISGPSSISQGQAATFNASWSGGQPPYTLDFWESPDSSSPFATISGVTGTSASGDVPASTTSSWKIGSHNIYVVVFDSCSTGTQFSQSNSITVNITAACSQISNCTLYGPASATQGQQASFTANWTGGNAPYNADFYTETGYFMSSTNISGNSATINPTIDATKFAVGNHTIFVNVWYRCADGSAPNCQTSGLTFNVVAPTSCTTPSLAFLLA